MDMTTTSLLPLPTPFNETHTELPPIFTTVSVTSSRVILAYCLLFVVGASGNGSVLLSLCGHSLGQLKWRISILMLHLAIADLLVICVVIPSEVAWRMTISWAGGDVLCRVCQFGRAFGLYLSSLVLICISVDRFYAIVHPLRMVNASRRVKVMIGGAWVLAAGCALPQALVFSVERHPKFPTFQQCVTYAVLRTESQELVYNLFSVSAMYFLPLVVILFTYSVILAKIVSKSKEQRRQAAVVQMQGQVPAVAVVMMARAKWKILRLTCVIVVVFVVCWTPYVVMLLWYMFDRQSAQRVDRGVQDALFMMAVANSCVNPFVYGGYARGPKRSDRLPLRTRTENMLCGNGCGTTSCSVLRGLCAKAGWCARAHTDNLEYAYGQSTQGQPGARKESRCSVNSMEGPRRGSGGYERQDQQCCFRSMSHHNGSHSRSLTRDQYQYQVTSVI